MPSSSSHRAKFCFVSYAQADAASALRIVEALEAGGVACWVAPRDVSPGTNWGQAIIEGIDACPAMALVLSHAANQSVHVANEVERAVSKKKRLFTILIQDVKPSPTLELHVSSAQWTDLTADVDRRTKRLVATIKLHLNIRDPVADEQQDQGSDTASRTRPRGKFEELAAKFRKSIALSAEQIEAEVSAALDQITAHEAQSMGSWYINDANSVPVYRKLRERASPESEEAIIRILRDRLETDDQIKKWKAMRLLALFGDRDVKTFRRYWETQTGWVPRQLTVDIADNLAVPDRVKLLADVARFDGNARIRSYAFAKLLELPVSEYQELFVPAVDDGLRDADWSVRSKAVGAVALIDPEAAVEISRERLFEDPENYVRVAAAEVLGKHGPPDSVALVAKALKTERVNEYVATNATKELLKRFGLDVVGSYVGDLVVPC